MINATKEEINSLQEAREDSRTVYSLSDLGLQGRHGFGTSLVPNFRISEVPKHVQKWEQPEPWELEAASMPGKGPWNTTGDWDHGNMR